MTDTAEDTLRRGRNAEALMRSDAWHEAIADLRANTLLGWRATNAAATATREAMFFQMQAIDAIEARLTAWVESAKLEAARIEKAERRTSRQA